MSRLLGQESTNSKLKRFLSSNTYIFPRVIVGLFVVFFFLFSWYEMPFFNDMNDFDGVHASVLSVGAIFAGFLFTALGILISILDRRALKVFTNTSIKRLKTWMLRGTAMSILASLMGFAAMINELRSIHKGIVFFEVIFLLFSMTYFVMASIQLMDVFDEIWNEEHLPKNITDIDTSNLTFPDDDED